MILVFRVEQQGTRLGMLEIMNIYVKIVFYRYENISVGGGI